MLNSLESADSDLMAVIRAHKLPMVPLLFLTVAHAAILAWLGHWEVAVCWALIMAPVDLMAHVQAAAMAKEEAPNAAEVEARLFRLSLLRYSIIVAGPFAACVQRAEPGELAFMLLTVALVSTGSVVGSGYRFKLILAGFIPAILALVLSLAQFKAAPNFNIICASACINVLMMAAMMRGVVLFSKSRRRLSEERRKGISELLETRDRLEDALDAKSVFLSTLSHEVRTPLNGVMGLAEVLSRSSLDPHQKEQVATIIASGVMMRTILDDVLDAAKIEAGRMELSPSPTDLDGLIRQVGCVWAAPAELKSIDFKVDIDVGSTTYLVDAVRVQQIINNFLSNAVKFTTHGGVRISARILDFHESHLKTLRIEVTDSGIGLTPEACEKLFRHFVQADASVAGRFGGSGVGLYVSKNLATLMNGRIGVVSQPGEGSTFWLEIEVEETAAATPCLEEDALHFHLLAVDDNPTNRKVVCLLLEALGHSCVTADDGLSALAALQAESFDLVLLDLRMPGLDGHETLKRIRALNGSVPVVALTADASDWTQATALNRGFDGFIAKPIEISKLAEIVACVARGRLESAMHQAA